MRCSGLGDADGDDDIGFEVGEDEDDVIKNDGEDEDVSSLNIVSRDAI